MACLTPCGTGGIVYGERNLTDGGQEVSEHFTCTCAYSVFHRNVTTVATSLSQQSLLLHAVCSPPRLLLNLDTESDQPVLADNVVAGEIGEADKMIEKGNRSREKVQVCSGLLNFCGFLFISLRDRNLIPFFKVLPTIRSALDPRHLPLLVGPRPVPNLPVLDLSHVSGMPSLSDPFHLIPTSA